MSNGSWQSDPYARHQLRWWDGTQWTQMVSDNGVTQDESAPSHSAPLPPPHLAAPPPGQPQFGQPLALPPAHAPNPNRGKLFAAIGAVAVIAVVVVVVIATRGGGGDSTKDSETAEGKEYVAAMVESGDNTTFTRSETRCIAEGAIDIIGVEAFQDAGITPDDIASGGESDLLAGFAPTEAQADSMIDLMFTCVDFGKAFTAEMVATGVSIPSDKLQCIGDELEVNTAFRAFLLATILSSDTTSTEPSTGDDAEAEAQAALLEIFTECGVDPTDVAG